MYHLLSITRKSPIDPTAIATEWNNNIKVSHESVTEPQPFLAVYSFLKLLIKVLNNKDLIYSNLIRFTWGIFSRKFSTPL